MTQATLASYAAALKKGWNMKRQKQGLKREGKERNKSQGKRTGEYWGLKIIK